MFTIPTRSRPHRLQTLIDACRKAEMSTPAAVIVDFDDPMIGAYRDIKLPEKWILLEGQRRKLSTIYNNFFQMFPDLEWYGLLADDVVPTSRAFDAKLIAAAGTKGMAFGDDSINGGNFATHFVLGGDLVRDMGWLALPGLSRIYIDTVWNDVAQDNEVRRYLSRVKMDHHHFSNGKALMDSTYRKPDKEADKALYEAWRRSRYAV